MTASFFVFAMLALVAGGLAADGDVGQKCGPNSKCNDIHAFCDVSDAANPVCTCKAAWVPAGGVCMRGAGLACGDSVCVANSKCTDTGTGTDTKCQCDTVGNYVANGDNTACVCKTDYVQHPTEKRCVATISVECTADRDCITNAVCDTGTCRCDTDKLFATGADKATTCLCDGTKTTTELWEEMPVCKLNLAETCAADSDCITGPGVTCSNGKCGCATEKNFIESGARCACAVGYKTKADQTCGLVVNPEATTQCEATPDCVDNAVCDSSSGKCSCDNANHWEVNAVMLCECAGTYTRKMDGTCALKMGERCESDADCTDFALCTDDAGVKKCACDSSKLRVANGELTFCDCDTTKTVRNEDNTVCLKKTLQECSATSECISSPGLECLTVGDAKVCTCNEALYYRKSVAGEIRCACKTAHTMQYDDRTCALNVGEACSSTTAPCVPGGVCDKSTNKCACDETNNYAAGTAGATACQCQAGTTKTGHICAKNVNETCDASPACTSHSTCKADPEQNDLMTCTCTYNELMDGSCSAATGLAVPLGMLLAALMLTSRLL